MRVVLGNISGREAVTIYPSIVTDETRIVAYHTGAGETARVLSDVKNEKAEIFAVLSGAGHLVTSITSTRDHWGSSVALQAHDALFEWICSQFSPRRIGVLCQSMGGLSAYNWCCRHVSDVVGVYGIYPVTNLASMLRGSLLPVISAVYSRQGIDLSQDLALYDPIRQVGRLAHKRIPAMHRHGDADQLVQYGPNALEFAEVYRKHGGRFELVTVPGLGHQVDPAFFNAVEVLRFMNSLSWGR